MATLSLVTVAHKHDAALLTLQARSLALYCDAGLFEEIIVIDNSERGEHLPENKLLDAYGRLAPAVRFYDAAQLGPVPEGYSGWWTQQVRKLQVAALVDTDRYVLLDAKNHLVHPLRNDFFTAPDGRARTRTYGYGQHPLLPKLEHVLRFMDLPPFHAVDFVTTAPPFTIITQLAQEILAAIGRANFGAFFLENQLTEFFYYWAYVLRAHVTADYYTFDQPPSPLIWPHQVDPREASVIIAESRDAKAPIFGVHRGAVHGLRRHPTAAMALAEYWTERGLFENPHRARAFLDTVPP